ncbi:unnamed protein product [Paramecium octaurelia]|uniref:Cache domain-containing protein n=1 Tax=Paramecium octaurelia TaxID=43137 RepID=A0A8S1TT26_PAROT|nr:unnamed protein product [Paramecium octaurelia]
MTLLSNQPMKTQLLTYSTIVIIIVSVLTYLTGYFGGQYMLQDFLVQSDIIYERVNSNKSSLTNYYLKHFNSYFEINSNPLIILNKLYLHYLGIVTTNEINVNNFGGLNSFPSVLADKKSQKFSDSIFCYAFKQEFLEQNTEVIQEVSFADFLAPLGQIIHSQFDENRPLLYGYIVKNPQILYSYPCYSYGESFEEYVPESRPWFKVAQNTSEKVAENFEYEYSVSDPYLFNQAKEIGITLSLPLIDRNLQFQGAWCMDIFPEYLISTTEKMTSRFKSVSILIVSTDGMIIKDDDNKIAFPVYFYNQSITGFDMTQWQQLKGSDQEEYQFQNSLKGAQSILKFYLKKQQLFILFIVDSNQYISYLMEYQISQQQKINEYLRFTLILLLMTFFILLLLAYLIISFLIMRPIEEIIWFFQIRESKTMKEKYEDLLKTRFRYRSHAYISPTIKVLQEAAYRLNYWNFKKKNQKNAQCSLLQLFQFPKNTQRQKISLAESKLSDTHQMLQQQEFLGMIRYSHDQR